MTLQTHPRKKQIKATVVQTTRLSRFSRQDFQNNTVAESHAEILFCSPNWITLLSVCYFALCYSLHRGTSDPGVAAIPEYEVSLLPGK